MPWARVDDGWWSHPKVITLDLDARGLWISVLSWSCQHQTDHVPDAIVRMCGGDETVASKLVDAGLWIEDDGGYLIHDWDDYQSERAKKAAAGRKGGKKSGESRRAKASSEADDGASGEAEPGASDEAGPSRPGPSRPDPAQPEPQDTSDEPDVSDEARQLTRRLAVAVKDNGHPIPKPDSNARDTWLVEMDRLLRIGPPGWDGDPPDPDTVADVIDFATSDPFWMANIQSAPKFRQKFSQLRLKAINGHARASPERVSQFTETKEF